MHRLATWLRTPFVSAEMSNAEWSAIVGGIVFLSALIGWTLRGML